MMGDVITIISTNTGTMKWTVSRGVNQIRVEAFQVNYSLSDPGCTVSALENPIHCECGYTPYLEHQWNCKVSTPDHDCCVAVNKLEVTETGYKCCLKHCTYVHTFITQ